MALEDELFFLDKSDREILNRMIERELRRSENESPGEYDDPFYTPNDIYVAKVPSTGITARSGTTLGKATCDIFKLVYSTPLTISTSDVTVTAITNPDASAVKRYVFNPYPVPWYYKSGTDQYIVITADKFGRFLCEKPQYEYLAKANADITAGSSGSTLIKDSPSGTTLATVTAYNDWMNGGQKIGNTKEGIVKYFELEDKWRWINAECE